MVDFDLPVTPALNRVIREDIPLFLAGLQMHLDDLTAFSDDHLDHIAPIPGYTWLKSWANDPSMRRIAVQALNEISKVQGIVWRANAHQLVDDFAALDAFESVAVIACNCLNGNVSDLRAHWVLYRNLKRPGEIRIFKDHCRLDLERLLPEPDGDMIMNVVAMIRYCVWFQKALNFEDLLSTYAPWLPHACLTSLTETMVHALAYADESFFWSASLFLLSHMNADATKQLHPHFRRIVRRRWIDLPVQQLNHDQWIHMHTLVRPTLDAYRNCILLWNLAPTEPSTPAFFDTFVRFSIHLVNMAFTINTGSTQSIHPSVLFDHLRVQLYRLKDTAEASSWSHRCCMLATVSAFLAAWDDETLTKEQWDCLQPLLRTHPHLICLPSCKRHLFGSVTTSSDEHYMLSFVGESHLASKVAEGNMHFRSHVRPLTKPVHESMLSTLQLLLNQLFLTPSKGRSWWTILADTSAVANEASSHVLHHLCAMNTTPMTRHMWSRIGSAWVDGMLKTHQEYSWFRNYLERVHDVYVEHGMNVSAKGPIQCLQMSMRTWLIENLRLPTEAPLLDYVTPDDFYLPCRLRVCGMRWSLSHTLMLAMMLADGPMMDRVEWVAKVVHLKNASVLCEQDFLILASAAGEEDVAWRLGRSLRAVDEVDVFSGLTDEERLEVSWYADSHKDDYRAWLDPWNRRVHHGGDDSDEEEETKSVLSWGSVVAGSEDEEEDGEEAAGSEDGEEAAGSEDGEEAAGSEDGEEAAGSEAESESEDGEEAAGSEAESESEDGEEAAGSEAESESEDGEEAAGSEDGEEAAGSEDGEEAESESEDGEEAAGSEDGEEAAGSEDGEEAAGSEDGEVLEGEEGEPEQKEDDDSDEKEDRQPTMIIPEPVTEPHLQELLHTIQTLKDQPTSAWTSISVLDMIINLAFCRRPLFPPSFSAAVDLPRRRIEFADAIVAEQLPAPILANIIHTMNQSDLHDEHPIAFVRPPQYTGITIIDMSLPDNDETDNPAPPPADIPDECPLCCEPVTDQQWLACDTCNEACCYTCAIRSATSHHDLGKLCPHAACGKHSCNNLPHAICLAILPIVRHMSGYLIREPSPHKIKVFEDMGGVYPFGSRPIPDMETVTRNCPSCCAPIERAMGCLHMTCRCGHAFCWNCMGPAHTHYDCEGSMEGRFSRSAIMLEFSNHILELTQLPSFACLAHEQELVNLHCRIHGVALGTAESGIGEDAMRVRMPAYAMVELLPLMTDEQLHSTWMRGVVIWCEQINDLATSSLW
jgi:hypothetical protein